MSSSTTQSKTKTGVFSRARKPDTDNDPSVGEGQVRRSISIRLIRHGESMNNQVYHDARRIYKGGTPEFDLKGWLKYVDERRVADPGKSAFVLFILFDCHCKSHVLTEVIFTSLHLHKS